MILDSLLMFIVAVSVGCLFVLIGTSLFRTASALANGRAEGAGSGVEPSEVLRHAHEQARILRQVGGAMAAVSGLIIATSAILASQGLVSGRFGNVVFALAATAGVVGVLGGAILGHWVWTRSVDTTRLP